MIYNILDHMSKDVLNFKPGNYNYYLCEKKLYSKILNISVNILTQEIDNLRILI
jgi:hypothetical protein